MVLFGGCCDFSGNPYDDVWVLNITSMTWLVPSIKGTSPEARWGHVAVVANNQMLVAFGSNSKYTLNDVAVLDFTDWRWMPSFNSDGLFITVTATAIATATVTVTITVVSNNVELNVGDLVGIIFSILFVIIAIVALVIYYRCYRSRNNQSTENNTSGNAAT